jgi:ribose transport system substrate-binding protein
MVGSWQPGTKFMRLVLVASLIVAVAALAACGDDDDDDSSDNGSAQANTETVEAPRDGIVDFREPEPGSGDGLKLGYIALGSSVPFSNLVTDGIEQAADAAGAELVVCDSQLDGQKALDCARNFKTQGVEGYLNFQVDQALASAICDAGPDGPVIAIDIVQEPCQDAFMGAANEYAGFIAGQAVGEFASSEWDCDYDAYVSLESTASPDASEQRMGGYREGFQSVCPGELKNERVLDADRTDSARTKFTDVLTALPGQDRIVVVALNDDGALGALAAANTAGRGDDIWLSAQGADPSAHCEIANNPQWIADTGYFPERYGEIGVPYLIDAVKGEKLPKELLVPHELITAENIADYYEVEDC